MQQNFSGLEYVKIDIANHFGLDKLTFKQRIAWVDKNKKDLRSIAPEAKNMPRYIAGVIALEDALVDKPSGHLVGLDAASSCCQIMAVLIGCETTARNTGLIGNKRNDLYTKTTEKMSELLGKKVEITRELVKSAQVPCFYGSKRKPRLVFGKNTPEYYAFYEAQEIVAPGAVEIMKLIQKCWQPYADTHEWVMPDGFHVIVPVVESFVGKVEVDEADHLTFQYQTDAICGAEQGISLLANVIQSCDGYVAREMVRRCPFDMISVHDEFMAHPNNMNYVRTVYMDIMAEIAESDLLKSMLSQITKNDNLIIKKHSNKLGNMIREGNYAIS